MFGFIYAGIMPLYAVLARENFPLRMMGTVIGGMSMASSLGMASGPLLGGLVFDTFGSYSWLFIGSWGIGIGAFLISMTFRPFAEAQRRWRWREVSTGVETDEVGSWELKMASRLLKGTLDALFGKKGEFSVAL